MKATTNNIKFIAKQTLYKGEGEVEDELEMNIFIDMYDRMTFRVRNWDGETLEDGAIDAEALCEKINSEGWEYDENKVQQLVDDEKVFENCEPIPDIMPTTYTTKSGYVMNMYLVTRDTGISLGSERMIDEKVAQMRGWYNKKDNGYMLRSFADAQKINTMLRKAEDEFFDFYHRR